MSILGYISINTVLVSLEFKENITGLALKISSLALPFKGPLFISKYNFKILLLTANEIKL